MAGRAFSLWPGGSPLVGMGLDGSELLRLNGVMKAEGFALADFDGDQVAEVAFRQSEPSVIWVRRFP